MRKLFLLAIGILFSVSAPAQLSNTVSLNDTRSADKLGWQLAVHSYTFQKFPILDAIDKTAALGVKYMSVSGTVLFDGKRIGTLNLSDEQRVNIDKKLKADGFGNFINMGVVKLPADEAECRKVFEFAKKWGIGVLVSEPETDALDTVEKLCKEYNIKVAIHNHPKDHSIYWNPEFILAAIKGRTPLMGACADIGHWMRSGLDPLECLKKLAGHIICLHFKDLNEMGPNAHDVPWGTGVGKIKELLAELQRQHFHGAFCVEYEYNWENSSPEIAQSIKFFNKACDELAASNQAAPAYKRPDLPVDERVSDFLGRMTLAEKARQLAMYCGCQDLIDKTHTLDNHTHAKPDAVFDPQFAQQRLGNLGAAKESPIV